MAEEQKHIYFAEILFEKKYPDFILGAKHFFPPKKRYWYLRNYMK